MSKYSAYGSIFRRVFSEVNNEGSHQIQVNCPRCRDRDDKDSYDGKFNLEINLDLHVFRCWKCDDPKYSGRNLEYLLKEWGNKSDVEEFKQIRQDYFDLNQYNKKDQQEEVEPVRLNLPDEFIPFTSMNADDPDHMFAYNHLVTDRKVTKDVILKHRIGFCLDGKYRNRIIIPSYDKNGHLNYFVARTWLKDLKPKYLNPDVDKRKIIYNEGFINWDGVVYLVEGGFEELSFSVNTIPLLGKNLGEKLFYELKEKKPEIIVILDPDATKQAIKLYEKLQAIYFDCMERVKIIIMEGEKDLDEVRREFDIEGVKKIIESARYLKDKDYIRMK